MKTQQQNNINIIENNVNENNSKIHNYLNNYKYKNKKNENNKRKKRPNQIKKSIKNYVNSNSNILKSDREEGAFNLYKYLLNNSNMKRIHAESLFKKLINKKNNTFRLKIRKCQETSLLKSNSKNPKRKKIIHNHAIKYLSKIKNIDIKNVNKASNQKKK